MTLKEFVDEIYASHERDKDTNFIFFLGAGCSKSSGIPLASELALEWFFKLKNQKEKFSSFFNKYIEEDEYIEEVKRVLTEEDVSDELRKRIAKLYFKLFETLFPDMIDRQKEIQRLTEGRYPSLGYYQLAQLMRIKAFNVVITTNFDDLIYDALLYSAQTKRARVISHHHLAQFIDRGDTPHIIKLHGDAHLEPFNDHKNTQEIEKTLAASVQTLLTNSKLIIIGYSGGDQSIAALLESVSRQGKVYWCNKSTPEMTKLGEWWNKLQYKEHVEEVDFDKIMSAIGEKFKLGVPNFEEFVHTLKSKYYGDVQEAIHENKFDEVMQLLRQSYRAGNYRKGLKLALKSKEAIESQTSENDTMRANIYSQIGSFYQELGKYNEAMKYYDKALNIYLTIYGENHSSVAKIFNQLGALWDSVGDYDRAIVYYNKALKKYIELYGENNPKIAMIYTNIGEVYESKEDYDKAIEYYGKSLKIQLNAIGRKHLNTAMTYHNLGLVLHSKGENNKAIKYYRAALDVLYSLYPDGHPYIDIILDNMERANGER